ncbi:MAG: hypothetical protein ACKPEY_10065, partial [Planctomycetota bacterium]
MKYQELIILLPCHSLEDFPTYHEGDDAEGLLAAWTSLWHPALLAAAGVKPSWCRVDCPPTDLSGRLLIAPTVSTQQLPTGFAQRAKDEGGCLVRKLHRRADILAAALRDLDGCDAGVDPDLAADFLALGYAYLQVQLLTRQMRYSSNLDEVHFQKQVVAGATAAVAGNAELAREKLAACFDMLSEERNHYYPVEAYLIDFTLVAATTLGDGLRAELERAEGGIPTNLVVPGETLRSLAEAQPATQAQLRALLAAGKCGLVGGEVVERCWPLMSLESLRRELLDGAELTRELLGVEPQVYGRRRFGLTPTHPTVLSQLGYSGALHATLDDGRFPQGSQIKVRWEAPDGRGVETLARPPLDVSKPQTMISLAMKLGESMDSDHVATLLIAHWPQTTSPWLEDLRRTTRYSAALGRFVTVEQYFRETAAAVHHDRFEAAQYRSPYLKQAIIRRQIDPISGISRYWRRRAQWEAATTLRTLAELVTGKSAQAANESGAQAAAWARQIDQAAEEPEPDQSAVESFDQQLQSAVNEAAARCCEMLGRGAAGAGRATNSADARGVLILNPLSTTRRLGLSLAGLSAAPAIEKPVLAVEADGAAQRVVLDVPPLGYAYVGPAVDSAPTRPARAARATPPLAEETYLRNEYFEAIINPVTGSLQSIHEYDVRGNRISQQLAFRTPAATGRPGDSWQDPEETASYSVMAADEVRVTAASATHGELTVRGRLLDRTGQMLAKYTQQFRVWRGSRVLGLEIHLEPTSEPAADPWNSYYACRFAWADESAELFGTLQQSRQPLTQRKFESPHYIDIVSGQKNTTILTGGLPYHRRVGYRMLDSLLIVRGERSRRFQLGITLDSNHPQHDAQALLQPPIVVPWSGAVPAPASSWLLHLDAKNVQPTCWEAVWESGRVVGVRVRLLETMGRAARVKLSTFRPLIKAEQVDFRGNSLGDGTLENGSARLELPAYGWSE